MACAACHRAIYEKQKTTEMAQAGARPAESRIILEHPAMSYERGGYTYTLRREGGQVIYAVSDGHEKITEPLFIASEQTASFISSNTTGSTTGRRSTIPPPWGSSAWMTISRGSPPASLEAALGRPLSTDACAGV